MKLKKIASLMLAGIMAVSMLAACGEGKGNSNSGSSSSESTGASGYSAMLGEKAADMLKANDLDEKFTFTDDNDDQKALKEAILSNTVEQNIDNAVKGVNIKGAWESGEAGAVAVDVAFRNKVSAGKFDIADLDTVGFSMNDTTFANVWVANGSVDMDSVMDYIYDDVESYLKGADTTYAWVDVGDVNYTYDISVSVENVALKYDTTKSGSVNFIAVTVVRSAEMA